MYKTSDIRELHIELTERCNASCPMCARYQSNGMLNPHLSDRELKLEDIKNDLPIEFIEHLEKVRFCGNFGDPAVTKEAIEIISHFKTTNPRIAASFHTNGGVRDHDWWYQLGRLFRNEDDELIFALDGLEKTLPLYRRNVSFNRAFQNACSAIRAGAKVHWVMLVFEHNEHEVEEARNIANQNGFTSFRLKATKRFLKGDNNSLLDSWKVQDKNDVHLYEIKTPKNKAYLNPVISAIRDGTQVSDIEIDCHVVKRKSIYLSAERLILPCCWIGSSIYPANNISTKSEILSLLDSLGGLESLSLKYNSLEQIVSGEFFQEKLPLLWKLQKPGVCSKTCNSYKKSFTAQFIERTDF